MGRPKRSVEDTWYDLFADWPVEDQAAALKVLTALHRQKQRETRRAAPADEPEGLVQQTLYCPPEPEIVR